MEIKEGVTYVGQKDFDDASAADRREIEGPVVIEDGVMEIPERFFSGQRGITSVAIPDSVKSIGDYAFEGCSDLKEIRFPENLEEIGFESFSCCHSLEQADLSGTKLKDVDVWAFSSCENLKDVKFPEAGVDHIEYSAFEGCTSLSFENMPESLKPFEMQVPADQVKDKGDGTMLVSYRDPKSDVESGMACVTVDSKDVGITGFAEDGTSIMSARISCTELHTVDYYNDQDRPLLNPEHYSPYDDEDDGYFNDFGRDDSASAVGRAERYGGDIRDAYCSVEQPGSQIARQPVPVSVTERMVFDYRTKVMDKETGEVETKVDESKKIVSFRDAHSSSRFGSLVVDTDMIKDTGEKAPNGAAVKDVLLDPEKSYTISEQRGRGENKYFYHKQMSGQEIADTNEQGRQSPQKADEAVRIYGEQAGNGRIYGNTDANNRRKPDISGIQAGADAAEKSFG